MIIKINNKNGEKVAECSLIRDEFDCETLRLGHSFNCLNVTSGDVEQGEHGFDEVIEIDIDNLISPNKINLIKSLAGAWTEWEVLRNEYHLYAEEDYKYAIKIIHKALLYKFISEDTYLSYLEQLKEFLGWEDDTYFTNDTYTDEDLDNFIYDLNPIYDIW